jgi:hypothetical protein
MTSERPRLPQATNMNKQAFVKEAFVREVCKAKGKRP